MKTSTATSDRSPRRSRTKSLFGVLVATALLAGATQALAPASASAMADLNTQAGCNASHGYWLDWANFCFFPEDEPGGSTPGGPSSGGSGGGPSDGGSSGGGGGGVDPSKPIAELPGPPAAESTPDIVVPLITKDRERWDAIYFPVDSLGVPLERRRSNAPRRGEGHGRSHGGGGRRRSSRD